MAVFSKVLLAAIAASAVQAFPQPNMHHTSTTVHSSVSTATAAAASSSAPAASAPPAAPAAPPANSLLDPDVLKKVQDSQSKAQRFKVLLTDGDDVKTLKSADELKKATVFDFKAARPKEQLGGVAKAANVETFPILTELGISTTLGFLEPCGMNTPHVHNRATEFLTLVEGSNLKFGYVLENGIVSAGQNAEIAGSLDKFQGTVFPQGSIHYQFNDSPDCKPATFVAGLNSEDPGTNQIAQGFFGLNADIVDATLGFPKHIDGKNIAQFRKSIPPNLAQGIESCLKRCNIDIAKFPLPASK